MKDRNCKSVAFIFLLLVIFLFASCNTKKKYKIGVVLYHTYSWREKLANEINYASFRYDDVDVDIVSSENNSELQCRQIARMVKEKSDLLIISPIGTREVANEINKAMKKNVPVVLIDNKAIGCDYTAYIGADNVEIGYSVGTYIGHMLKGKGRVAEIQGKRGDISTMERHKGFLDALSKYPDIQFVASRYGDWTHEHADREVEDILRREKEIDAIFYHSDGMIDFTKLAVDSTLRKTSRLIGVDALTKNPSGIEQVMKGYMTASFIYPTRGDKVLELSMRILHHEAFSKDEILPTGVVDKNNVEAIMQQHIEIDGLDSQIDSMKSQLNMLFSQRKLQMWITVLLSTLVLALVVVCLTIYMSFKKNRQLKAKLEDQYQEMELQTKQLIASNKRLLVLNQQIEEDAQTKLNFFTNVSHEFRTPLTLIAGPVEKLRTDENLTEEQRAKLLNVANKNLTMLTDLVSEILDYRKVQNGMMELKLEKFDLVKALKDWTDNFKNQASSLNIDFKFLHDGVWALWIQADRKKMTSIMVNLLGNAFKYTQEGGKVTVSLSKEDDNFRISVEDTGKGIEDEYLPRIFDGFYQAPDSNGGTGVGLALTKSFVELHKGQITVESQKEKGSTFQVVMPIMQEDVAAKEILPQDIYDEEMLSDHRTKVLVVDDNKEMCGYVRLVLGTDYIYKEAYNGQEGYDLAVKWMPDIIVCDVMMPIMDGLTCCLKLKSTTATSHIPVILLTARSMDSNFVEGYDSGADGYITKPFSAEVLQSQIENLLANRALLRKLYMGNDGKFDSAVKPIESEFVKRFQGYLEESVTNADLSVEDVAKYMNLSRAQLYAKIKSLTGESPVEHIRNARLEMAKTMLLDTELNVSEIAYKTGFSAPSYFSKCFRDQFGMSPNEFRTG